MKIIATYDISDPKRLKAIADTMMDYGTRVQKSIFEIEIGRKSFKQLKRRVELVIDPLSDNVKFYERCKRCQNHVIVFGEGEIMSQTMSYIVV